MSERNVDPLNHQTPIVLSDGRPTPQFIQQWTLQRATNSTTEQELLAAIALVEAAFAAVEAFGLTEIGGDNVDIEPGPAPLSAGNITLGLTDTGVTPDTYGDATNVPQITVDSKGRITGVVDVPITGGGGGGGGGSGWEVVFTQTITTPVSEIDVTGLGDYEDLIIGFQDVTTSVSTQRAVRVSVDNGATFFASSSAYEVVATAGTTSGVTSVAVHGTANANARSGQTVLLGNIAGTRRYFQQVQRATYAEFKASTDVINAIRLLGLAGNLTGGVVYIVGRKGAGGAGGVTTVAALGSASPAGQRRIVSDANATTFNSVVAGGGANTVPVYSDGTNWRIG